MISFKNAMLKFRKFAQYPNLLDDYSFIEELAPATAIANKMQHEVVEFNQLHECLILDSITYYHSFYFLVKSNLEDKYCIFAITSKEASKPEHLSSVVTLYKIL